MAQGFIQLNTDGTGKKLDTVTTTTAAQHRQVFALGDSATDANVAGVTSFGAVQAYDIDPPAATGSISAADSASTTNTGQGGQSLITGTPTTNSSIQQAFSGNSSVGILITGTFVGTLAFERSLDNGVTWGDIGLFASGTSDTFKTTTLPGQFHGNASSCTNIRVRATAWTSGTATVRVLSGEGVGTITVGSPVRGVYNTTPISLSDKSSGPLQVDSNGNLKVNPGPLSNAIDSVTTYGTFSELTGLTSGALNSDLLPSMDVSTFKSFGLQVLGTWSGTLTVQGSNDATNWVNANTIGIGSSVGGQSATITSNNIYVGTLGFRYMRVRMTAYTSGAATATAEFYTVPAATPSMGILAAQSGTWNTSIIGTPTVTTVSVATSSTSVLSSNSSRKALILSNAGANNIYVNLSGGTAVNTNTVLVPNTTLFLERYVPTTAITAIAATGATNLSVTELV